MAKLMINFFMAANKYFDSMDLELVRRQNFGARIRILRLRSGQIRPKSSAIPEKLICGQALRASERYKQVIKLATFFLLFKITEKDKELDIKHLRFISNGHSLLFCFIAGQNEEKFELL